MEWEFRTSCLAFFYQLINYFYVEKNKNKNEWEGILRSYHQYRLLKSGIYLYAFRRSIRHYKGKNINLFFNYGISIMPPRRIIFLIYIFLSFVLFCDFAGTSPPKLIKTPQAK